VSTHYPVAVVDAGPTAEVMAETVTGYGPRAHYPDHVFLLRPDRYVAASFRTDEVAQGAEKVRTLIASTCTRSNHSAAALAVLPIAALTRGITSSAISCIERLASVGSTQSMPA